MKFLGICVLMAFIYNAGWMIKIAIRYMME